MRTGAVIAAAGMSTRMKQFKQMMKVGDMMLTERVIVNFKTCGVRDIVVVTGYRSEEFAKALQRQSDRESGTPPEAGNRVP